MIVLNTTSQSLQATLAAGTSTTPLDVTVVYYDRLPQASDSEPRYTSQESTISSATVTTICAAPGQDGIVRNVVSIFGYNRDVTSATLAFNKLASTVSTFHKKATLTTGQTLWYEHGFGWAVL